MADAQRALMRCRAYLKMFEAGPNGGTLQTDDLTAPSDMMRRDATVAAEVLADMKRETIFDAGPGSAYLLLQPDMRRHMAAEVRPGVLLADRIREMLAEADRGEEVPGEVFKRFEHRCRWGD